MPTRSDAVAEKLAGGYANLFSNTNIFNEWARSISDDRNDALFRLATQFELWLVNHEGFAQQKGSVGNIAADYADYAD